MEANNINAVHRFVRGWQFRESAAAPEIAGRDKPLADCRRSGGLAA
jgi:hypothetical protein